MVKLVTEVGPKERGSARVSSSRLPQDLRKVRELSINFPRCDRYVDPADTHFGGSCIGMSVVVPFRTQQAVYEHKSDQRICTCRLICKAFILTATLFYP